MTHERGISRRDFIIATSAAAGGMALTIFSLDAQSVGAASKVPELTPWIVIAADNTVTVRVPGPEAGTGGMTQIAMLVAEELQCAWEHVRTEPISFPRNTREADLYIKASGIWSTFAGGGHAPEIRATMLQAGASARERLRAAAAARWNVPVNEIEARESVLRHPGTSRSASYGEFAAQAARVQLPSEPTLKPETAWTVLRKQNPPRLHVRSVVDGSSMYGIDVRRPGMLYAALAQCPVHGGKLKSFDFEAIRRMPGVRGVAVIDPQEARIHLKKPAYWALTDVQSGIAVVADHYWQARKALEALPLQWDYGPGVEKRDTQHLYDALYARLNETPDTLQKDFGDAPKLIAEAGDEAVVATYLTPLSEHATLEPLNGTALVTKDKVELWHPAAMAAQAQLIAQEETGVAPENIEIHMPLIGGSFGRRVGGDDLRMVLAVAKKFPGTPIHVIWSREETFRQGRYRDLQAVRFAATLDKDGLPEALVAHVAGHTPVTLGLFNSIYANGCIPNVRIETSAVPMHVLTGQFRGPGYNSQCFFIESFIDECAARAGIDPLEYRLRIVSKWPDSGWTKCLREVAAHSRWGQKLPPRHAQGIAMGNWGMEDKPFTGTTIAAVATVEVTETGSLIVHAIDVAFDSGKVLNIDAVNAQLQGSTIFGLNLCLHEELHVKDGQIVEANFDSYKMLRMADIPPRINVHASALSGHDRYGGTGEVGVGVVGPAVANAIFRATARRIRAMPFGTDHAG
ncbi:MAG: molybdopterin cofactor-binding domain-containing protein [Steroidobacter sp.]